MNARGLFALAVLVVFIAGCQGGMGGEQILGTLGSITGFGPSGPTPTASDVRGAFGEMDEPEEIELGRSIAAAVGARYKVSRDRSLTRYVALVGNTVAAVSDRPDVRYYFAVLDSDEINALAAPGGFVFVTRGALALMPDESALAGVLGHEIGHIALRHHEESIKAAKRKNLAVMGLQQGLSFTSVGGFSSLIGATADALAEQVILKGHSRAEEMESDKVGFQYAARAGYDPAGLREFLAALAARGATDAGVAKFFSTHPGTDERLREQSKMRQAFTGSGKREAARFAAAMGR
jgi:beta-barrel assembly-enhancing protease